MAYSVESKANNPANLLRDDLDRAEREVVKLDASNIELYLLLLDQIEKRFGELTANDTDLRPELGRWDSLLSRLQTKPEPLVAAAARVGGLAKLRQKHQPAESFWWHLDKEVARRRAQAIKQAVTTVIAAVVLLGGGYWALNFFFPPSPAALQMMETTNQLDQLIAEQRWQDALTVVETAQKTLPDEAELVLWEMVFAEQLGETDRANAAWTRAQAMLPDMPAELLVQLGNQRLQVGNFQGAWDAGQEALVIAPENAQATFLLGGVAESVNDIPTAIAMFDRTFALAEEENAQLAVIARVRMGNLLQRAPAIGNAITPTIVLTGTAPITTAP